MNAGVDGLIERYKRARADLAAAVQAVEKTKGEAIRAAMSWRDAEYLHQVGILTGDDVGLAQARQQAAAAIRGLEQAREALAAAQQGVADLEAVVKERRRELEAKARQNWVHQHWGDFLHLLGFPPGSLTAKCSSRATR